MKVKCLSDNREMILSVLQNETGASRFYAPLPEFSFTVGSYILHRNGYIETELTEPRAFKVLAALGLCDYPYTLKPPVNQDHVYHITEDSGKTMMNLISMVSARQHLLNRALDARRAFFASKQLMADLAAHPPVTTAEFLQGIYGRNQEYEGVRFTKDYISLSGFRKCHAEEAHIHRQLSDLMFNAARSQLWTKAFTPRVRNQKYAFRTWLNSIGMVGPEYEEARRVLLGRLPGRTDQRCLIRKES